VHKVLAECSTQVEDRDMKKPSNGRVIVVVALAVVALVGAFLLGRLSAPDKSAAAGPDCSKDTRFEIDVPAQFKNAQGTAYFTQCEERAGLGKVLGSPASRVNIYAARTGSDVLAWWYPDCGFLDGGVVPVGAPHPKCADVATTATAAAP
jgi:hypothetical protein